MNYWHPSARATAPQGTTGAAVYYPQYTHPHGNGRNNALQGSYTPMPALVPLPTDPSAGLVGSFPASSQSMLHLTESYHQGATSPPFYQAPIPSGSVTNHPLFSRPPSVLDSLHIPLLPLPPTTTPVLPSHPEVEGLPQPEPASSVPTTTKRKRKTAASKPTAKRRKKSAADAVPTPAAAAPCGVGPTIAPDTIEDLPQPLHAYTNPTMSSCGRGSSTRKNGATDVWHFLMTVPSVEKPDVLPDITQTPILTANPGANCGIVVTCHLCV